MHFKDTQITENGENMLANTDLQVSLDNKEYTQALKELGTTLSNLQQLLRGKEVPVIIVFEGWGASGKGTSIARLVNALDPRYFDIRTTGKINEEKRMRPFLWSFWTYLPPKGQIVILDKSWHRLIMPNVRDNWGITSKESEGFYNDVKAFERQLTDDGALVIKLFLHISKKEQKRRFKALESHPTTAWRVKPHDWVQNKQYDHNLSLFESMLEKTQTKENPWHIIEAEDKKYAAVKIIKTIISSIENRLGLNKKMEDAPISVPPTVHVSHPSILKGISPYQHVDCDLYKEELTIYQQRMHMLGNKLYAKRRSAIIVYEGWDAAGKGGNIKRLTNELDPRCYAVVPIGPPRPQEFARHYLWRFLVKTPKDGHITIFDRSWYGRVLVERVDELTPPDVWARAYNEINEMEQHLVNHGVILLKFWLHIDKDEQLRRFTDRQNDPSKQHKITEDDWRNRKNWELYEEAANEMLAKTHHTYAPWIIVESNNKKFARLKVLKTVTDALDDALK